MDSFDFIDSVKTEKANALARYRRFTNITKFFQLIEVFVAVALISWSSTRLPTVFKVSGEYVLAFSSYLMNQHVVFLVGNVIVVVCYVLSRHTEGGNESGGSEIYYDNGKYSQLNHQKTTVDAVSAKPVLSPVTEPPITKKSAEAEIKTEKALVKSEPEVRTITAIKQATKQIERFQRTQSDKLKFQNSMKPRRELRRSVTERSRRSIGVTPGEKKSTATSFEAVDRLSNEEFRLTVEAFISKQQSFLKQQSMDIVEDRT